jgi:hypothetical protein
LRRTSGRHRSQDVSDLTNLVRVIEEATDSIKLYETIRALEPLCPADPLMGIRSTGPVLFSLR